MATSRKKKTARKRSGVKIRKKYKLHAYTVAQGYRSSAGTEYFDESYEEAEERAMEIVESDPNCRGIVIYEAIKVIRPRREPITVEDVE